MNSMNWEVSNIIYFMEEKMEIKNTMGKNLKSAKVGLEKNLQNAKIGLEKNIQNAKVGLEKNIQNAKVGLGNAKHTYKDIKESLESAKEVFDKSYSEKSKKRELPSTNKTYGTFPSSDGKTTIDYMCISPSEPPKMIFQFFHGMAEYKERYTELGEYLAQAGIAFFIADHLGHGKSIISDEHLGYFGKPEGWKYMVYDGKALTDIAKRIYPDIPFVIGGHSMGSFVTRAYLSFYPNIADKAVIVGTGNGNVLTSMGKLLAKIIGAFKGSMHRSQFLNTMAFAPYNKKIENPITPFDWLSLNEENVRTYMGDPLCGFTFTANGFENLTGLLGDITKKSTIKNYNRNTEILLLAGKEDPVGSYTEHVVAFEKTLKDMGVKNVTTKLYDNLRHEILNEECKQEIFSELLEWLEIPKR